MATKRITYPAKLRTIDIEDDTDGKGRVEAIVSVFGNVDLVGDRVVKGAFKKSIESWMKSGDAIPAIFSHDWADPFSHLGEVEYLEETDDGLKATYTLDIDDNPVAAQIYKLMKRRTLKEHSFAYDVKREKEADDGANELLELDIIEVGPTLKGANPSTELLAVKSAVTEHKAKEAGIDLDTLAVKVAEILEAKSHPEADAEESDAKPVAANEEQSSNSDTVTGNDPEVKANDDPAIVRINGQHDLRTLQEEIASLRYQ